MKKNLSLLKNRNLRFLGQLNCYNKFTDFVAAAKYIDDWQSEFSCLVLDYDLQKAYGEVFSPYENKPFSSWVFNDFISNKFDITEEELNVDEITAKEYRVIALLLANEMQKTGDL